MLCRDWPETRLAQLNPFDLLSAYSRPIRAKLHHLHDSTVTGGIIVRPRYSYRQITLSFRSFTNTAKNRKAGGRSRDGLCKHGRISRRHLSAILMTRAERRCASSAGTFLLPLLKVDNAVMETHRPIISSSTPNHDEMQQSRMLDAVEHLPRQNGQVSCRRKRLALTV